MTSPRQITAADVAPFFATTPVQTFVAVPVFTSGNAALVVAANPNRVYLEIINNGTSDVELWFGAAPADADVGKTVKKGVVLPPAGGRSYDARVPLTAIYATSSSVGGLSVVEG